MYGLYKYVCDGEVIYIGKSDSSIDMRIDAHAKESKFKPYLSTASIYYTLCKNPAHTTILETYLINKYKPKLNVSMKYEDDLGIEISEPKWELWTNNCDIAYKPKHQSGVKLHGKIWIKNRLDDIEYLRLEIKKLNWLKDILPLYEGLFDFEIKVPFPKGCLFSLRYNDNGDDVFWNISGHSTWNPNDDYSITHFHLAKSDADEVNFWDNYISLIAESIKKNQDGINEIIKKLKINGHMMAQAKGRM